MAELNSTSKHPLTFAAHEVIRASTLRRVFGGELPSNLCPNEDGSVLASDYARCINEFGIIGLAQFESVSEIVVPGSPEALAEF